MYATRVEDPWLGYYLPAVQSRDQRHFVAVSIDYEIVLRLSLDRNNIVEPYFCPASSALG
jgi:hypothetical protein